MSRYTILHTIETAGPGGAETVVLDLASRLDQQRFRSIVLLPNEHWLGKKLREKGVEVLYADGSGFTLAVPRAMARIIRREKVNLVHSHLPDQNFSSCIAGQMTGCKIVVTYHGAVELANARELKGRIKLWTVRNTADRVVVVCDYVGRMLLQVGFPENKLLRIYNGVHSERFRTALPGVLRAQLGLTNGTRLIGMVGNIRPTKGHEFFVRAAKLVLDQYPDVRFVAAGDTDTDLAQPIWQLVRDLNLGERVHFLGFREDIPALLADMDVVVLPSTSEGFPLAALEAMASGRPLVATRCGGPQEVVEDGVTGYLVPPADPESLAARIKDVLGDSRRAASFGAEGRTRVEQEFSISKMISQYENLYTRLLEGAQ